MLKRRLVFCLAVLMVIFLAVAVAGCGGRAANDITGHKTKEAAVQSAGPDKDADRIQVSKAAKDGAAKNDTVQEKTLGKTADTKEPTGTKASPGTASDQDAFLEKGEGKTGQTAATVHLVVTKDFGNSKLLDKKVRMEPGWTVFDVLQANCQVKTGYSGGLITGINGVESQSGGFSGPREDWFFFVNGICSDVGAGDYELRAGDSVWWDYHSWDTFGLVNSAVIGCYPEPFLHGYRGKTRPTTVLCAPGSLDLGQTLKEALKTSGVSSVQVQVLNESLLSARSGPTIVVGEWRHLKDSPYLDKLNQGYRRNGTFVHFTEDGVELLDYRGEPARVYATNAAVIAATGEGLGDGSPLWLVIGIDREGLEQAVAALAGRPEKISGLYSAAVVEGKVMRLPF
ncbi:MAG TPA: DUF4430 domain-containing protein [Syntrophothermus lipocalidus]|nr:DUF4430 domain-containing protein [Syntrophothermus lipocalidus]